MAAKVLKPLVGLTMIVSSKDMHPRQTPHNDALVIQLEIATTIILQILVDIGSSVDIIILEFLKRLQYSKDLTTNGGTQGVFRRAGYLPP